MIPSKPQHHNLKSKISPPGQHMDLLTGALGSVLEKLGELLKDQYNLQAGVREKITTLARDLESMHAALRKVAKVPTNELDEPVKLWARDVRELSYDAEDVLDTFLVDQPQGRKRKDPDMKWYQNPVSKIIEVLSEIKTRHKIGSMVKNINEKAEEVAVRRGRYRADDIVAKPAANNTVDPRLKLMYKEVAQLVGIEKSSGELTSMLSSSLKNDVSNKKLKIVSVVGFGGLGKTSLVKAVYDKLESEYDCGAFVSVGQNPILVNVFKNIFFVLSKQEYQNVHQIESIDLLIGELRKFLRNKRYIIVIDDIWEIESWEIIYSAFLEDNNGSRIITTTRKAEVAQHGEVYKLQPLSDDNSKRLFYTRIFGGEDKCPHNHPDGVSYKILKKCDGVPLAIITMASLLMGKTKEKWVEVCDSPGFHGNNNDRHVENTMHILSLSYYDLPSHLKTCLLYLSVFPEDYIIDKDSLIFKWIAEDFVEEKPGRRLFEIGEEYFYELVNRSMIQEVELENCDDGLFSYKANGCRVHDMVLHLICTLSIEESFVTKLDNVGGTTSQDSARRVAYQNRTLVDTKQDNHIAMPQVRSFIAFVGDFDKWFSIPSLKLLRVLALENCKFREDWHGLEHIGSLLHLRYLGIRYTNIPELPKEIGALKFLQTLDLAGTCMNELPSSISMLTQLVCLRAWRVRVPDGIIGKLTSLESLHIRPRDNDESKKQFVKDLGSLRELRVLETEIVMMDERMQQELVQSLGTLQKIQRLILLLIKPGISHHHLLLSSSLFDTLPSCINASHLPVLSHLHINVSDLDDEGLKILGGLPELRYLYLYTFSTARIANAAADGCFQKLTSFLLPQSMVCFVVNEDDSSVSFIIWDGYNSIDLVSKTKEERSRVEPDVMPNLQELQFKVNVKKLLQNNGSCDNLGLEYLSSLQKVNVDFICWDDMFEDDAEKEEAALRNAMEGHPNRPTLRINSHKIGMKRRSGDDDSAATSETEDEASSTMHDGVTQRTSFEQEEEEEEEEATEP